MTMHYSRIVRRVFRTHISPHFSAFLWSYNALLYLGAGLYRTAIKRVNHSIVDPLRIPFADLGSVWVKGPTGRDGTRLEQPWKTSCNQRPLLGNNYRTLPMREDVYIESTGIFPL